MGPTEFKFGHDARDALLRGVETVGRAIGVTLGPRGRTVLVERPHAAPWISADGYTIARHIDLPDKFEDMGARLIRHVGSKVTDDAGDGTTTAMLLACAIIKEGVRAVAAGLNPMELKRGIDIAVTAAHTDISQRSSPAVSNGMIARVGTVSADGDAEIGTFLARAINQVGQDGVITIEQGKGIESELIIHEGMSFDRGYVSPHFITDDDEMAVDLENAYILLHEGIISDINAITPALRAFAKSDHALLVIAEDIVGEALSTLVVNKLEGGLRVAAVKAPGFGPWRKPMLEDIAIMAGGQIVSDELGSTLEKLRPEMLGAAKRVRITRDRTVIMEGACDEDTLKYHCNELRAAIEGEKYLSLDRERLQERLARLVSGVITIRLGGATETELRTRVERAKDALNAARAAAAEGVVPGGGVALLRASRALDQLKLENEDQRAGVRIVRHALATPARKIAENCGADGALLVAKVMEHKNLNWGYDAQRDCFCDLVKAGIVDPTKIVNTALRYAASAAALVITAEAAVAEIPKHDPEARSGPL
jgi:chaperonin GroEL